MQIESIAYLTGQISLWTVFRRIRFHSGGGNGLASRQIEIVRVEVVHSLTEEVNLKRPKGLLLKH